MIHDLLLGNKIQQEQGTPWTFENDPFEQYVIFRTRAEGPTLVDDFGHTFTNAGSAISYVNPVEGAGCLDLTPGIIYTNPPTSTFALPGMFTVDFYIRHTAAFSMGSMFSLGPYYNGILVRNNLFDPFYVNGEKQPINVSPVPIDSQWHKVVVDRDGDNVLRLLVDDVVKSSTVVNGTINSAGNKILLGASYHSQTERMAGQMDFCRLTKGISRFAESL